ncbi:MAG: M20/M25/M40 family metallo-hydrolase [bacterium]
MMKRPALLSSVLVALAFAAGPEWLAYVEYGPGRDVAAVDAADVTVVFELEAGCLVTADEAELAALARSFECRRLDRDPDGKHYMYATTLRGPLPSLAGRGEVLYLDARGAVLLTDSARAAGLDGLGVELARIHLRPRKSDCRLQIAECRMQNEGRALPAVSDSLVWGLVGLVSQDSVEASIRRMQGFRTRYSTTDSCRAAMAWIRGRLESYGCDTVFEFPFRNGFAPNVIGVRYGTSSPQRIYGVCGHADATSEEQNRLTHAPGSDDNASGTTAVLEAARVFQDVEFENTVYFMAFAGEEQGLYGSDSFAEFCYRRGDSIKAVLNFDMISYGRENRDSLDVIGKTANPPCGWLVDFYIAQADTFTDLKTRRRVLSYVSPNSDHYPFLARGYPALMGIERDFTPAYHTTGDTVGPLYFVNCGTNNLPLATDATRAAVATVAKLAGATVPTGLAEIPARPARALRAGGPRAAGLASVRPSIGTGGFRLKLTAPARHGSRLRVYGATGRLVRSLDVAGRTEAGWDGLDESGRRASAGSYLFRLVDGRRATTLRAVLTGRSGS